MFRELYIIIIIYTVLCFSAPNVSYSFTVAGVTDSGTGPASDPVDFSTPEGGHCMLTSQK